MTESLFCNCVCVLEQKELRCFGDPIKAAGIRDRPVTRTHKGILPWRHTGLISRKHPSHPGPRTRSCSPIMETHMVKGRKHPLSSRTQEQILKPHFDSREMGKQSTTKFIFNSQQRLEPKEEMEVRA